MRRWHVLVGLWLILTVLGCGPQLPQREQVPAELENPFGPWQVIESSRPDAPAILQAEGDAFRVDSAWQVASITWVDKWWGTRDWQFHIDRIERQGDGFVRDGEPVPTERVQAVLAAMGGFYQTQFNLAGRGDNEYLLRLFEIVGTDGQRLLLSSKSTGNPGAGPWNLSFNGQQWAQFDGSVGMALFDLFEPTEGRSSLPMGWDDKPWAQIAFSTTGMARQDIEGLVELQDSVGYRFSEDKRAIEGYIKGSRSNVQIGRMVIGTFDKLLEVALTLPDGTEIQCSTTAYPTDYFGASAWDFTCPLGALATSDGFFRMPLRVTLGTTEDQVVTSEGALVGSWEALRLGEDSAVLRDTAIPQWLSDAVAANEQGNALLATHHPILARYEGGIPVGVAPARGIYAGELAWAGWTEQEGRQIPYTISSSFAYADGQLTMWSLTTDITKAFVEEVMAQPLTQRLLKELPQLTLNLLYDDVSNDSLLEGKYLLNAGAYARIGVRIGECEGLPGPATLGDEKVPLRAYGFDGLGIGGAWSGFPFVLLDSKTVVADLDLRPQEDDSALTQALLPAMFRTADAPQFQRIRASRNSFVDNPLLELRVPNDYTAEQLEPYNTFVEQIPGSIDAEWGPTIWPISNVTFAVDDQGYLVVHDCDPSD